MAQRVVQVGGSKAVIDPNHQAVIKCRAERLEKIGEVGADFGAMAFGKMFAEFKIRVLIIIYIVDNKTFKIFLNREFH